MFLLLFTFNFAADIDIFIASNSIFSSKDKAINFNFIQIRNLDNFQYRDTSRCHLIFNNDGLYKLKIDDRVLSYDGRKVKSYDLTTNQLFIQSPNNRLKIENFLNNNLLKNIQLRADGNNYIASLNDLGNFLVVVDSLKLINRFESIDLMNKIIIDSIEINFLDSIILKTFNIDIKGAMIFDMSNE